MSIAVSVVVRPSPRLRCLLAAFALQAGAVALGLAFSAHFAWPLVSAVLTMLSALFLLYLCAKKRYLHRVDISGIGQIRLAVYHGMGDDASLDGVAAKLKNDSQGVVSLMPGSTLWPNLLLLRLRAADGKVTQLLIWPDSVADSLFRPLLVACRIIAARADA